jgi:ribosomal-protein-alanine N-acetyltransferase
MTGQVSAAIDLVRLTDVPLAAVRALLNEPRNARHMPLAGEFDDLATAALVSAKDAQWASNGYGPWAVLVDGEFAGWGGFQHERAGADLALVLAPRYWGRGRTVARLMLERGFGELGFDDVVVALPHSRDPGTAMSRLGFRAAGKVEYDGVTFRQYRLARTDWVSAG